MDLRLRGAPLKIRVNEWKENADSPVCLMVDDLANVWVESRQRRRLQAGDDWGHHGWATNSCLWWLQEKALKGFEDIAVTFFVPVARVPMIRDPQLGCHFGRIDETPSIARFFHEVHAHPNYELAYHGITHGVSGTETTPFVHEWESFDTLDEAIETTRRGMELFREVTGEYPKGGKYCGYMSNSFSDRSIDQCGFRWWCRHNNRGFVPEGTERAMDFSPGFFGENLVVDLPTTLYGHVLWPIPRNARGARLLMAVLRKYVLRRLELSRQIDFLLSNKLPILIQEHSARSRTDGLPQTPNIVDDLYGLRVIFRRLSTKKVWNATCSEIADYYSLREMCRFGKTEAENEFLLEGVPRETETELSLSISFNGSPASDLELIDPDGRRHPCFRDGHQVLVSFVPKDGRYRIKPRE